MPENETTVKGFFLHFAQVEALCNVPPEHITSVLLACVAYCKGEMPDMSDPFVKVMFPLMRPALDKSLARAAAGKRGGEANESKMKQNEANESEGDFASICSPKNKNKKKEYNNTTLRVVVDNVPVADASTAETASEETALEAQKPSGPPPCPHREIIDAYHELLPELPRIRSWTTTRSKHLAARWKERLAAGKYETAAEGIAYWRRLFEHIHGHCPWLMGQRTGRNGRAFYADLGWLVMPENFAKVIEGRYTEKEAAV